nr:MDR family MFS transporter [Lacticaseibacillus saniviri]
MLATNSRFERKRLIVTQQPVDVNGKPYNRLLLVITLLVGTFTTFLTQTILTTAFPTLMQDFNISASAVQWLTTGFMLVMGIMIPISAWLLSKINVKVLYLSAMTIFFFGTLLARFAPTFGVLLAGRLIEAVGVGISAPTFQTVMFTIFPANKRGSAMGLAGIVIGLAPAIGPTLSGWVLLNNSWRALFTVILPIALAVIVLASYSMRKVLPTTNPKIDLLSVAESTIGFGSLLYGFSSVGENGWTSPEVMITLAIGIIFVALFVYRQLHMDTPLLELRVFKSPIFTLSVILTAVAFMSMVGVEMVLPMYLQTSHGQSAFNSGLILFPGAIMMGIMSPITGRIFDRIGAKRLANTGLFLLVLGTIPLMTVNVNTPIIFITVIYTLRMFGITMVTMPVTTAGMNALPDNLINHGTAVNNTVRQVAASIGTALLVSVLSVVTKGQTPAKGMAATAPLHFAKSMQSAVVNGYRAAFVVSLTLAVLGFVLSLFLKRDRIDNGGDQA